MAYRFANRFVTRRLLAASATLGGAGIAAHSSFPNDGNKVVKTAEQEFHTSSMHPVPQGWSGRVWQIRNDYPGTTGVGVGSTQDREYNQPPIFLPPPGITEAPWMQYDFKKDPEMYCKIIKDYCWEGNVNNDFVVQNNTVRKWYHAAWMHWGDNGREPLNGLTFELPTPPGVLAKTQKRYIQNWACGYYNEAGASVFGEMWKDIKEPAWNHNYTFPDGTAVFKLLYTEATPEEIPSLKGSPTMKAVIAKPGEKDGKVDPLAKPSPKSRNNFASDLRLLQVDFAVKDPRAPIGWIFGTFIYDNQDKSPNPWDRIIPVGLMWGNSPKINQKAYDSGEKPYDQWMNPKATNLMKWLGGTKPMPGWNERTNGPVDNFISACASCHSVAQLGGQRSIVPPKDCAPELKDGKWVPKNDKKLMLWFRNIESGKPFTPGTFSADYSLQLMIGYHNYYNWWRSEKASLLSKIWFHSKYVINTSEKPGSEEKIGGLRDTQFIYEEGN